MFTSSICNQIHVYKNHFQEISSSLILEIQSGNKRNASNLLQLQYENVGIFGISQLDFYFHIRKVLKFYDEAEHASVRVDFSQMI